MNRSFKSLFQRKGMFLVSVTALLMLVLAACAPAASPTQSVPQTGANNAPTTAPAVVATTAPTMSTSAGEEATVNVATDAKLGKILVDGKGMTLYMYTKDTANTSTCAGGCLANWPALQTQGSPKAGDGVDASLLGVTNTTDGKKMVTYNKMPLYYWAKDKKPGDTTGQGVGKVWFVVSPDGKPVGMTAAPAADNSAASASGVTINVADDAKLGKILVDGKGMTLYIFTKDDPDKSNCADKCLQAWPPLVDTGSVKAGDGVNQSMIGSTTLADGRKIVTYNKMPLYYFAKDTKAGDTTGQDVNSVWYVVGPDGNKVDKGDTSTSSSNSAASDVMVNVATDAKLGKILVDGKGMALYIFTKDGPNQSNCTAGCLKAWPPLVTKDKAGAGDGVDASLLGTATLADGSKIVTYNKMPLYYWAGDTQPGQTTGQGVNNVWFVVSPDGKPVSVQSSTGY